MGLEIASLFARIGADLTDLEAGLNKAQGMLTSTGERMSRLGSKLSTNVSLPLAAVGAAATKAAFDLDKQMRNIQSISKESDQAIAALSDRFVEMSTDMTVTTDSAQALAKGFYDIQSSGFFGADAMTVLEKATKAATAGLSTTDVAAKAITAKLNAYGDSAEDAGATSDIMFKTVDRGVLTFEELAMSLSNVMGSAASAGIGFEVVSAGLATLTKQGMTAAEASVALNQVILGLLDPSDALEQALHDLGYESGQAALDQLGLAGTLNLLTEAGYDTTTEMAGLFGNVRALRGVLGLTGDGAKLFAEDLNAMGNAAGATEAAFEIQMRSMSAQIKNLTNEATALGIEMIQAALPAIQDVIKGARELVGEFRALSPETQSLIVKFGMLAIAAGPALKVLGGGIQTVGALAKAFQFLAVTIPLIPAFLADIGAGLSLIAGGGNVFAVATTGAAGFAAALVAIAGPLAVVVGAILLSKKLADDRRNSALAESSAIMESANSYEAYAEQMRAAASEMGMVIDAQGNLIKITQGGRAGPTRDLVAENYLLSESAWRAANAEKAKAGAMARAAGAVDQDRIAMSEAARAGLEFRDSVEEVNKVMLDSDSISKIVEERFTAAGVTESMMKLQMDQLAVTLGTVTQGELDLANTVGLVADAYAYAVIGQEEFNTYMQQARDGTLQLNSGLRTQMSTAVEHAKAMEESQKSVQAYALAEMNLATALKDASKQQIAQAALSELGKLYEDKKIDFPAYFTAMKDVSLDFGLVDEESLALSEGIMRLNEATANGVVPAENYSAALSYIVQDASDGQINFGLLLEKFGEMPEKITTATTVTMEQIGLIPGKANEAATGVEAAFSTPDWSGVGSNIGQGVADGITQSTPAIAAAATQAAKAALAAMNAELEVKSPSRKTRKTGREMTAGLVWGVTESTNAAAAAVTRSTESIANGVMASAGGGAPGGDVFLEMHFHDAGSAALGLAYADNLQTRRLQASM